MPQDEIARPVAEAVSEALAADVEELPPLSDSINLDGLDAIVTENPSHDVIVAFSFAGLRVVVHSSNAVWAYPTDEGLDTHLSR